MSSLAEARAQQRVAALSDNDLKALLSRATLYAAIDPQPSVIHLIDALTVELDRRSKS